MVIEQSEHIITEVKNAFMGKDEIIRKVLMTIYAGGHILLEDCPGVGKTTLVLAFANALGLDFKRIQYHRYHAVRHYRFFHVQPGEQSVRVSQRCGNVPSAAGR